MAPREYRVLIILDTIEIGGPGKGIIQFCKFAPQFVHTTVANFSYPDRGTAHFDLAAQAAGITHFAISQSGMLDVTPIKILGSIARDQDINLIQSHSFKAHIVAYFISRQLRLPWVAFAHGWTAESVRVRLYNYLEKRLLGRADHVCVVSRALSKELTRFSPAGDAVTIVPNAVELGSRANRPYPKGRKSKLRLVCAGRLSYEKGQDILLRAIGDVDSEIDWQLDILGDGPERIKLQSLAHSLGLTSRISFHGYVRDVSPFICSADFLVLPSRSEGIPNIVLEAMASGLPVIASNVGGLPEIITDRKNGFLVEPNPTAFRQVLNELVESDLPEKVALSARRLIEQRFTPQSRVESIVEVHRSVLKSSLCK